MRAPSYVCRNRFGVYFFRMRIPERLRKTSNVTRAELRYSLRTKDKRLAIKLARQAYVAAMSEEQFTPPVRQSKFVSEASLELVLEIVRRQEADLKALRTELA